MTLLHPRPVVPFWFLAAGTATTSPQEALAQTQNEKILQDFFIWAPFCASLTGLYIAVRKKEEESSGSYQPVWHR